jgi:hypothetical protein
MEPLLSGEPTSTFAGLCECLLDSILGDFELKGASAVLLRKDVRGLASIIRWNESSVVWFDRSAMSLYLLIATYKSADHVLFQASIKMKSIETIEILKECVAVLIGCR